MALGVDDSSHRCERSLEDDASMLNDLLASQHNARLNRGYRDTDQGSLGGGCMRAMRALRVHCGCRGCTDLA
eukprot:1157823-Pelagomonas_calceolata.AAC.10